MELHLHLQTLYSLAEGYGIPAYAVNVILTFALVLILGRPIISFFLHLSYRRLSELSPETKSSYIGIIHIGALVVATLSAFLNVLLAAALAFIFIVVMPIAVGLVASRRERKEEVTQSFKRTTLQQALRGKKKKEKPRKASAGTAPTESKKKKQINIGFRLPSFPLPRISRRPKERKERKREEKKHKVRHEHKEPTLVVEEITFKKEGAHTQKRKAKASVPPAERAPKQVPPAEAIKIKEFRKAVAELEAIASGQKVVPVSVPPVEKKTVSARGHKFVTWRDLTQKSEAPVEPSGGGPETIASEQEVAPVSAPPGISLDERALVREVEKAVEEKVISARRHRFVTWREVLEMRKRAKETVKRMEPVVKERVRRRLREKGKLTREDLNEIAEEILYQIQRSEAPVEPKEAKAEEDVEKKKEEKKKEEKKERPRRRRREKKKKEKEEDVLIGGEGEEDILALLGEEESEEDIEGDLEELEKLLGEG